MDTEHKHDFEKTDLILAEVISQASYKAKVKQIIYLGGLGKEIYGHPLSTHLKNRQEVADMLRASGVSVTEIRAGVIIGAGSASFEIIRSLGMKLPFIPKLDYNQGLCNPIDVDDVISYLLQAYKNEVYSGKIVEIGMKKLYRYDEMVAKYTKLY